MEITILFRCLRFKNSILNPPARGYRGVSGNGRDMKGQHMETSILFGFISIPLNILLCYIERHRCVGRSAVRVTGL